MKHVLEIKFVSIKGYHFVSSHCYFQNIIIKNKIYVILFYYYSCNNYSMIVYCLNLVLCTGLKKKNFSIFFMFTCT